VKTFNYSVYVISNSKRTHTWDTLP